ncbi:phage repressor protein [Haloarcula sediminis]|uniref:phage repressor protein n=1 Tax=Haloarcula sediminis TaxID=3111777 RepID=UPI002D79FACB|nr:phage repressor protein [Haloarcula sp. CK38]
MHSRVDWLKPSDWTIISEIEDYGGWMKPATLCLNIPYTREHIARRCKVLSQNGLLERHEETAAYRVTEMGRDYLAGELDADDLQPDNE